MESPSTIPRSKPPHQKPWESEEFPRTALGCVEGGYTLRGAAEGLGPLAVEKNLRG